MATSSLIRVDRHGRVRMDLRWLWVWAGLLVAFGVIEVLAIALTDAHSPARPWFGLGFAIALLTVLALLVRTTLARVRGYFAELRSHGLRPGQPVPWGDGPPQVR